jgi:hypothetical protein
MSENARSIKLGFLECADSGGLSLCSACMKLWHVLDAMACYMLLSIRELQ